MRHINITDYLDQAVAINPDTCAVIQEDRSLTIAQLRDLALRLAHKISERLAGEKRKIIAVLMPKCLEAAVADIAILYSGNAYMNLDINNPDSRLELIAEKTRPAMLLTLVDRKLENLHGLKVNLEKLPPLVNRELDHTLALRKGLIDTDLLCLINTSGSTGVPKAVALSHRGFIDFTEAIREIGLIKKDEIIGSLSPIIFDIWSFELCMIMAFGSTQVCLPESEAAFPARLLTHMQKARVTFIFWVPTIMVNIANGCLLDSFQLPDLRMVWFAGEVFPTAKFNYWRKSLPNATFANFYGPIEITLDCLYYIAERELADDEPIPVGKPFPNSRVFLLDENNNEVQRDDLDTEGEICVAGSSLAHGYYNDPGKTAQTFVLNPLEKAFPEIIYRTGDIGRWNEYGEIMFAGRKDTLIKHRGYRIELGEIENVALNADAGITNCCVLYDGSNIILVYEAPQPLAEKALISKLMEHLPRYMVPRHFWHFRELPRNPNGKIDRNYLKENWANGNGKN